MILRIPLKGVDQSLPFKVHWHQIENETGIINKEKLNYDMSKVYLKTLQTCESNLDHLSCESNVQSTKLSNS